ncbi:MAG: hypothetical protein PW734_00165 [Verrucomicrobium sp.]|nr:hypothetical protein [Verrucomicrobium sp.]
MRLFLLALLTVLTLSSVRAEAPVRAGFTRAEKLSDGYALLLNLCNEDKNADGIFLFKTALPETKETIKRLAALYKQIAKELEAWDKQDESLDLKNRHLPAVEAEARKEISAAHAKEIFAAKTPAFDKLYLTLQWQSLYYGMNLAKSLEKLETNPERRRALAEWLKEFDRLRSEVSRMIPLPTE